MIKALIVEPSAFGPVGYWRLFQPLQALRVLHPHLFTFDVKETVKEGDLVAYDWLILARPSKPAEMELISMAKKLGVRVVVDYDDDLLNIPPMHPSFGTFYEKTRQDVIRSAVAVADVVWCSTESIKESLGRADARVIPNAIDPALLPDKPAPIKRIAAWRGREQQYVDVTLQMWASGWYDKIKDIPDYWIWMGWMPVPTTPEKSVFVKYDNIIKYMDFLKTSGINNMWKPLFRCKFNDGKSNIAWLEATIAGGICVTNYAGLPGWEFCNQDFDFSEALILKKWKESCEAIKYDYNIFEMADTRLETLEK